MGILDSIKTSDDIRRLTVDELAGLSDELRQVIIDTVSKTGGHLASNLGVVELTLALHRCFDFPTDRLVWDVGHQCYVHKIISGRREEFNRLRQQGGLSGFPAPEESDYDQFSVGHAGTAIATALGLAHGDQLVGSSKRTVAVVGDASIVNGLSFEALNNAGLLKRQLLIILNDNSMAIDVTQGALAKHLHRLRFTHTYEDIKRRAETLLDQTSIGRTVRDRLNSFKQGVRTALTQSRAFEQYGLAYLGPLDGHDLPTLIRALDVVKDTPYPILLHVHTVKGRGCNFAASDPCAFHSPSGYEVDGDTAVVKKGNRPTFTNTFGKNLLRLAQADEKIVAITAAMPDGTGLVDFKKHFPDRYFDVGICESAAVDMAAGMAKAGLKPVVAIYSTFMQRAFDQVWQEVVLQGLPVVLCMDRAGVVGSDGAVHHGFSDIAFMQVLPNMIVCAPADEHEMTGALEFALACGKPVAIRYPRDVAPAAIEPTTSFVLGKSHVVRQGADATILAYGALVSEALEASTMLAEKGLDVGVVSARFAKPLDETLIVSLLEKSTPLIIAEDHSTTGGFGAAVLQLALKKKLDTRTIVHVGLEPDTLIPQGSRHWQLETAGLTAEALAKTVAKALGVAPGSMGISTGPAGGVASQSHTLRLAK